jgi:pseudouridine synthase
MEERLQKILAHAGVASRRECEKLISEGAVVVNGERVTAVGIKLDPEKCTIKVHGKIIEHAPRDQSFQYLILHKPRGVLTTMREDPEGRPTLLNLLNPKVLKHRLYPVGRLDFNSEGLLLLTNDGELAHRMTHPKFKAPKTYEVKVHGVPPRRILDFLAQGVNLEDGRTRPAKVKLLCDRQKFLVVDDDRRGEKTADSADVRENALSGDEIAPGQNRAVTAAWSGCWEISISDGSGDSKTTRGCKTQPRLTQ